MKVYYVCKHSTSVDPARFKRGDPCPQCGETKLAGLSNTTPKFAAVGGIAARGPLVKAV